MVVAPTILTVGALIVTPEASIVSDDRPQRSMIPGAFIGGTGTSEMTSTFCNCDWIMITGTPGAVWVTAVEGTSGVEPHQKPVQIGASGLPPSN
jgi:hypothetical protein